VSRERARRREAREAEAARRSAAATEHARAIAERRRRRDRRRAAIRSALPWLPGQRWSRRTRGQRATIVATLVAVLVLTFVLVDSWSLRVAIALVALLAAPAVVTLTLDRSTR
jgi:Flp pilus assembly protein TadB